MSSLNDGSGPPASQDDSIPLEDAESSMSIYSDEEREGEYAPSDQLSDAAPSSLDYSSVSRTYLSQSQSRGAVPQSEDYTGTASYYSNGEGGGGSNSYGYDDDEDYEYSSGYDSMTYGDTSLRSPHSELSSTFASFYYENELVVKARSTLHFLRRPLYYLAFATAGSGLVGSVCRLATTVVKRHFDSSLRLVDTSLGAMPGGTSGPAALLSDVIDGTRRLPVGYPDVPAWLQEVRASLPAVMEVPAAWMLQRHHIPVLSDLVGQQNEHLHLSTSSANAAAGAAASELASNVTTGVQEAWRSWQRSGPAIPVALFLPLFSLVVIKVARQVRPNPHSLTELLRAQQDAEDAEVASAYLSTTSPARPMSVSASPIAAAPSSSGNASAQSASVDVPPTSRVAAAGAARPASGPSPPFIPPVDIAGATRSPASSGAKGREAVTPSTSGASPDSPDDFPTAPRERSRSATQTPATHRHVAGEAAVDIDLDTGARLDSPTEDDGAAYDPAAKPPSPLPQAPPPALASAAGSTTTTRSGASALPAQARGSTLRGDVAAAVAGTPDVREANVALMAAARYGCSAVLLPASLAGAAGLLEAPPSLDVAFVNDVVVTAMTLADRRGLTLLGVTAQQWDAQAVPLDTFTHPMNSVYVFVSHEADNPAAVAAVAEVALQSVYVGTSRTELPANQIFYDRLQKEKSAR